MQKYCQNCGNPLPERAFFCPDCGAAASPQNQSEKEFDKFVSNKDPFIAAILSLLFPGLGQVYNGEFHKGLLVQIIFLVTFFGGGVSFLLIPIPLAVWVIGIYDAYTEADKMRKGQAQLKNPTLKEALIFVLWPFVLAFALTALIVLMAILIALFIVVAAMIFSIPFVMAVL